jgi:hypothetical protein
VKGNPRALVLGVLVCAGCAGSDTDLATERCIAALRYWTSSRGEPQVLEIEPARRGARRSIRYELGVSWGRDESGRITCQHEPGDPWSFTSIQIAGQELSPVEVSLVNGELFLRDLVENPERLHRP